MDNFNQIARQTLKLPEGMQINDALSPKDVPGWDSMNYLFFIAELEKSFKISFSMDEVMNAKCIGDIRRIVSERGKAS